MGEVFLCHPAVERRCSTIKDLSDAEPPVVSTRLQSGCIRPQADRYVLDALDKGKVEAIITDDAILRYQLKQEREQGRYQDLTILPYQLARQNYGFVLPEDHPNEERLNQALLKIRKSPEWKQAISKFLKGV